MSDRLSIALQLVERGYFLVPVTIRRVRKADGRLVKAPEFHRGWKFGGSRDPLLVKDWFVQWDCSFAIHHESSGTEAGDLDPKDGGPETWAALGLPGSADQVFTPSGGVHLYWRRVGPGIGTNAGKLGPGVDARSVGGVTFAPGSVVIGLDGEPESTEYVGTLPPVEDLAPTPDAVVVAFADHARAQRPADGETSVHDYGWVTEQFREQLARVADFDPKSQSGFREVLMGAAMMLGRGVAVWPAEAIAARLEQAAAGVWGNADDDDREWIRRGMVDGLARERWEITDVPDIHPAEPPQPDDVRESAEQRRARKLAEEVERQEIRAEAARTVAATAMAPLRVLDAGAFLDSPMPAWLVPGFLYRASTAKIYGPPGGTKSFLLLDLALSLATGRTWHGRALDRTRVHYVMAEGQAVNALRAQAWLTHHGLDRAELDGWFSAIPQGVMLTPEGLARYLPIVAGEAPPGLVVLDTKNRMMVGEENSASDVAVMVRAMDAIREASGSTVCLVDHTGLADQTRGRGSNAVTAAMDTEILVAYADSVATARVTRDKAGQVGTEVSYELRAVEVDRPAGIAAPAVCVPHAHAGVREAIAGAEWNDPLGWALPDDVRNVTGAGQKVVPYLAMYMRWATDRQQGAGVSRVEARKAVLEVLPGDGARRAFDRAWDRLITLQRLGSVTGNEVGRSMWQPKMGDPDRF